MKKYIFSAILIANSGLLMSQNGFQTNISNDSDNQKITGERNWWTNESRGTTNTNKPATNRGRGELTNIAEQTRRRSGFNESNQEDNGPAQRSGRNITPTQSVARNANPVQSQRSNVSRQAINRTNVQVADNNVNPIEVQSINLNVDRGGNSIILIGNLTNDNNFPQLNNNEEPVFANGNLAVNVEQVQNKQIQFLADNNQGNIQLDLPELDFSFENKQETQVSTQKVKTVKTRTAKVVTSSEMKLNFPKSNSKTEELASSNENIKLSAKTAHAKKHGNSSYSQKHKNYTGKKIKIWFKKNMRFARKIRASVSCPKF